MNNAVAPGTYVLAVSGGVDSMVLLNLLQQQPELKLIVAHFDHGIREDSVEDRQLVQQAAGFYGLPFVYDEGHLGPGASEAAARQARYAFLHRARAASGARAIITAHHQDDLLETAILNLLRGTGRKGLSSLRNHHDVRRPMLHVPKANILKYAQDRDLIWREDSTNQNPVYLRNYVRQQIMPRLDLASRQKLWQHIVEVQAINDKLDDLISTELHLQSHGGRLDRNWFAHLPHNVAREVMAGWLRAQGLRDFDRRKLERLVVAAKVGQAGSRFDILNGRQLRLSGKHLALTGAER